MTVDVIRLFPQVIASGFPDKHDLVQRKMERHQDELRIQREVKLKKIALEDIGFEIYTKKVVQQRLLMELFQYRKLDVYV